MQRIKEEREKLGYNQTEFAKRLGVANNTLNNYEKGNREPNIATLIRLADLLGCSIDYLVGRTSSKMENEEVIKEYYYLKGKLEAFEQIIGNENKI